MFFFLNSLAVIISLASSVPLQTQHHINSIDVDERPDKQADSFFLVFVH